MSALLPTTGFRTWFSTGPVDVHAARFARRNSIYIKMNVSALRHAVRLRTVTIRPALSSGGATNGGDVPMTVHCPDRQTVAVLMTCFEPAADFCLL